MPGPIVTEPDIQRRHAPRRRRPAPRSINSPAPAPAPAQTAPVEPGQLRVVHDVGHACGTVLMLAAALESTPGLDADARRFAAQLAVETRRMNEMVTDLLRVPADRPAVRPDPASVRLDALIESIADPVRATSGVTIDVRTTPLTVHQDPLALWRALRNLICNALQAVDADGHIRIELSTRGRFGIVDIDDDGPGLGDGRPRAGGLGLGLTIVEDFAAAWGGWFELGPGALGGCRARLIVPRSTTASPADGTGYADHPL